MAEELRSVVRRAAAGDEEAARSLVRRYEGPLKGIIASGIGDDLRPRIAASDVFQATMVSALADLGRFEWHGEAAFVGWLKTIAERQLLMAARFHNARKRSVAKERLFGTAPARPAEQPSPSQTAVQGEMTQLIRSAVLRLPAAERRVVELHTFEGQSFAAVASQLGLSGAARARYVFQRALKRLGRMLDEPAS